MSFGGSAQAMITTLKNNEKMRSKRKKFKRTLGGYNTNRKTEYNLPNATPEQLIEIRQRLKKENKILWIKVIVFSSVIIIALVWMLFAS
ncbi:hypothetical protein [Winogradskyella ouciana]|uniref:Uncharacterized protein n=1 Tax=Winogradskyella ouciana TaxID=2608631 RepID=A0A7K1GBB0_9FLAO|nr:hypothetical protein [Winogradskyella ouciana]MTE26577.1 hypothetical protein [Winogradskyella ouciana]